MSQLRIPATIQFLISLTILFQALSSHCFAQRSIVVVDCIDKLPIESAVITDISGHVLAISDKSGLAIVPPKISLSIHRPGYSRGQTGTKEDTVCLSLDPLQLDNFVLSSKPINWKDTLKAYYELNLPTMLQEDSIFFFEFSQTITYLDSNWSERINGLLSMGMKNNMKMAGTVTAACYNLSYHVDTPLLQKNIYPNDVRRLLFMKILYRLPMRKYNDFWNRELKHCQIKRSRSNGVDVFSTWKFSDRVLYSEFFFDSDHILDSAKDHYGTFKAVEGYTRPIKPAYECTYYYSKETPRILDSAKLEMIFVKQSRPYKVFYSLKRVPKPVELPEPKPGPFPDQYSGKELYKWYMKK